MIETGDCFFRSLGDCFFRSPTGIVSFVARGIVSFVARGGVSFVARGIASFVSPKGDRIIVIAGTSERGGIPERINRISLRMMEAGGSCCVSMLV